MLQIIALKMKKVERYFKSAKVTCVNGGDDDETTLPLF